MQFEFFINAINKTVVLVLWYNKQGDNMISVDENGKYLNIAFSMVQRFKSYDMEEHTHDNRFEIIYCIEGRCEIYLCNTIECLYPNQLIFINAAIPHRLKIDSPTKMMCSEVAVSDDAYGFELQSLMHNSSEFAEFYHNVGDYFIIDDTENIYNAMHDYITELANQQANAHYLKKIMLVRLLIGIARGYFNKRLNHTIGYLNKAKEYILNHIANDISVTSIAKAAGVKSTYLQLLFKEHLSMSVMNYVNHLRLEKSKLLLVHSNLSITQIAIEIGYNSRQNFALAFKKAYQKSPMSYRKLHS